jgi:hypothetical protein
MQKTFNRRTNMTLTTRDKHILAYSRAGDVQTMAY